MSLTRDEAEKKIGDFDKKRGNLDLATRQALVGCEQFNLHA